MSGIPRKRASLSCTECNRRKVKCSKTIPCERCIGQGQQARCTRAGLDSVHAEASSHTPASVQQSPDPSRSEGFRPERILLPPSPQETTVAATDAEYEEVTNAATILEFLAWGRQKDASCAVPLSPQIDRTAPFLDDEDRVEADDYNDTHLGHPEGASSLQVLQLLLPERRLVIELVEYHIESLLWYHGSFHGPSLRAQVDDFYRIYGGDLQNKEVDLQWIALLFAVLTGSLACGDKTTTTKLGFRAAEQQILCRKWLQSVVSCLNASHYMTRLSILSCQAIATLTISAHILGYSNQQSILLASATRIAQSLGLHKLGSNVPKSIARETGRRVWEQLCTQDFFSIAFAECGLINPLYCQSLPPVNCDDETLEDLPTTTPTITSYCRYLFSIAALMPKLQEGLAVSNTLFTKYEQVLKYDREMRHLATELRPEFLCNVQVEPSWPQWIRWARSAAAISSAHKIIMIHRKFLSMSFTNPAFAFTRKTCIAAAKTILKGVQGLASEDGPVMWIYDAFTVAAGITLCLDVLHRDPQDPICAEHTRLVNDAIDILQNAQHSKIAARGSKVLVDLRLLERSSRISRYPSVKRKVNSEGRNDHGSKRQCSVDIRDVVRDVQRGISPVATMRQGAPMSTVPDPVVSEAQSHVDFEFSMDIQNQTLDSFLAANEALANLHTSFMSPGGDAFGNLLSLAQTYSSGN